MFLQGGLTGGNTSGANFVAVSIYANTTGPIGTGTGYTSINVLNNYTGITNIANATGFTVNTYGTGASANIPPAIILNYIIKT
jgi:hypothetical protein